MARINTGTMTVGIFAVLFALVGAYALRAALVSEPAPLPPPPRAVNVPFASNDLPSGRKVAQGDMVLVPMTEAQIHERKLPLEQLMVNTDQIVGRILNKPIKLGTPFLTTDFFVEGTGPNVAELLKPGLRAITIPMDDLHAVGGEIVPGSVVDVLFRTAPKPAVRMLRQPEIRETTVTLMEGIEVLSVGRTSTVGRRVGEELDVRNVNMAALSQPVGYQPIRSVTLAVTPEQANIFKTVLGRGDISLVLRAPNAANAATIDQMTLEKLLGLVDPKPPVTTDIYVGGNRKVHSFQTDIDQLEPGYSLTNPVPVVLHDPNNPGGYGYGGWGAMNNVYTHPLFGGDSRMNAGGYGSGYSPAAPHPNDASRSTPAGNTPSGNAPANSPNTAPNPGMMYGQMGYPFGYQASWTMAPANGK